MLNKRYLLTLTLLSALSLKSFAQDFNLYLGASLQSQSIHRYENESNFTSVFPINDSLLLRRRSKTLTTNRITYENLPGVSAGFNYRKRISDSRWSVETGLGIQTGRMKFSSTYSSVTLSTETDTIPNQPTSIILSCDSNIIIGDYKQKKPYYGWVQLEIPLLIRYELVPGKWSVGVGANLSTPLHIVRNYFSGEFTYTTDEHGLTTCTTEFADRKDKSGNGFRDLNLGLSANMQYWFKRMGVSIGVEQRLNNLFSEPDSQQFFTTTNYAKPIFTYLRLLFKL